MGGGCARSVLSAGAPLHQPHRSDYKLGITESVVCTLYARLSARIASDCRHHAGGCRTSDLSVAVVVTPSAASDGTSVGHARVVDSGDPAEAALRIVRSPATLRP